LSVAQKLYIDIGYTEAHRTEVCARWQTQYHIAQKNSHWSIWPKEAGPKLPAMYLSLAPDRCTVNGYAPTSHRLDLPVSTSKRMAGKGQPQSQGQCQFIARAPIHHHPAAACRMSTPLRQHPSPWHVEKHPLPGSSTLSSRRSVWRTAQGSQGVAMAAPMASLTPSS